VRAVLAGVETVFFYEPFFATHKPPPPFSDPWDGVLTEGDSPYKPSFEFKCLNVPRRASPLLLKKKFSIDSSPDLPPFPF